jgi:CBS domain-containing protein
MAHRVVRDVMTADVVTATVDTPFKQLAVLLAERSVSGVPVLDPAGHVTGMVSAVDLMRKEEYQEDPTAQHAPRWHRLDQARARGSTAGDVMTSPAVTVAPDATVTQAARLMDQHRIKRLVVVDADGRLQGIVTVGDLLKVYLRPDGEIREEIVSEIITGYLGTDPALIEVTVADGVVMVTGEVERKSMMGLAVRMSRAVDGVVAVTDRLSFRIDDTHLPTAADMADS